MGANMNDMKNDSLINVLHQGIRRGIQVAIDQGCLPSAVILIYAGMDTMAYLGMPAAREDVQREDFVVWAERYVTFPCVEQLSGLDLYGARCAMLHTHSITARLTREGKCRKLGYADTCSPEVAFSPEIAKDFALVSIRGLADAFFKGVDRFLVDVFADASRGALAEARLRDCVHSLPYDPRRDHDYR
jgi:hypothetical protein